MHPTLTARRDKTGHGPIRTALLLAAALLFPLTADAAGPGKYKAQRFDVAAKVVGGGLDVTETIVFEFQSGTFKRVWRDVPTARTDGIDIADAWMDDDRMTLGQGPGHIAVSGNSRVRVEWNFADTGPSVHSFRLHYLARGVAYREGDYDVVRWRLLPNEHRYAIDESRSTITAPVAPAAAPTSESHRIGLVSSAQSGNDVTLVVTGLRDNGWVIADVRYPAGSIVATTPEWQARQTTAAALAPRWEIAAAVLLVAGLLLLFVIYQAYESPAFDESERATSTEPPEAMPAALAAALASKGRLIGYQSMATLLDLADRGVLTFRELPRRFGARNYEIAQVPGKHDLADHEAEALTTAFGGAGEEVTLSKASGRLTRGRRRFAQALTAELEERGLLDPSRKAVRDRLTIVSIGMLFAAGLACVGVAALIPRYQGWPFLMPLGVAIAGLVGVVMAAQTTPLSDAGLMQSARWRGFRDYLKKIAGSRDSAATAVRSRWIVYGIALGLGPHWARYLKRHPGRAPAWFVAAASDDQGAFAAFIGRGAAHASASGGGGGAAAGGGGSGAG